MRLEGGRTFLESIFPDERKAVLFLLALTAREQEVVMRRAPGAIRYVAKMRKLPYSLVATLLIKAVKTLQKFEAHD